MVNQTIQYKGLELLISVYQIDICGDAYEFMHRVQLVIYDCNYVNRITVLEYRVEEEYVPTSLSTKLKAAEERLVFRLDHYICKGVLKKIKAALMDHYVY